ncbi:(deoxy)nucleoside triphosphate pyrophosphohydrolase [Pedosphaera parvula]|uniref:8-oxo-dGTP diphosphatase n=1 Tax=Pedosphaera parvula (strain Ellin514) TaxID=320771 RepID=B9XPD3_PEDPL|nr:(deoxy)nucleoside triphosphate pyrophosphohydrolase [Pedosphaera parvula]EEF58273.1 NUDIX hydrolase [Pedosphaera parvula Ellin514]
MTNENTTPDSVSSSKPDSEIELLKSIEVSAGLVFRNGLLLITQRRAGDHLENLWEFPGGKRSAEESFEACLKRELMEELGIEVEVRDLVDDITHDYPGKRVHLKFFKCKWLRNEPQALACQNFAWVGPNQLKQYAFPAADERLLTKLFTGAELWR